MVQVRDGEDERRAAGERQAHAVRRPPQPEVEALVVRRDQRGLHEQAVAVLGTTGPAADGLVAALAGGAEQPVLLHRVDDLLQADQVRLEGGHVGQEQRQALGPAVGEVEDVQRGDEQAVHRLLVAQALTGVPGLRVDGAAGRGDRDRERERRAAPFLGLDPDPAAVAFDDVARDREAESRAAAPDARPVGLVEALEDALLVRLRDARPVVDDRGDDLAAGGPHRDPHLAAVGAELDRVVDEVDEDLAEARLVGADRREPGRDVDHQRDRVALGEQPQPLDGALREPAEIDVVRQRQLAAALDPGEVEELADHLDEVPGLDLDLRDPLAHPRRHVARGGLARQRLGEQAHRRQRRPELVAQVVDELGPDLLEAAQLRGVLEDDEDGRWIGAMRAHHEDPRLAVADPELAAGRAADRDAVDQLLRLRVEERLHDRAADEVPGLRAQQRVGALVGALDPAVGVEVQDPDREECLEGADGAVGLVGDPLGLAPRLGLLTGRRREPQRRDARRCASG